MADTSLFTTGGTVQAGGGLYLTRKADDALLALCRQGAFAFVLTARQMGKSSLMTRTAERLIEEGSRIALVDLNALGTGLTAEQWYLGFLVEIERQLELKTRASEWWRQHSHLGIAHRMSVFFEEILLEEVKERLILFVDEIDSTLGLDFTDDFFASIRSLYNARAQRPALGRLSFVLLGVATPGDLIKDAARTPFNLGQRVELTDFTFDEARPLLAGFELPEEQGRDLLRRVMEWTGGHPYLTQRLCREVVQEGEGVERAVGRVFLGEKSFEDNNLQFVRDMLTRQERSPDVGEVMRTLHLVRRGKPVPDDEQSRIKSHLKLSGVVRRESDTLIFRNRIYEEVFTERWIREHLPFSWKRLAQLALLAVGVTAALLVSYASYSWVKVTQAQLQAAVAARAALQAELSLAQANERDRDAWYRRENAKRQAESLKYRAEAEIQARKVIGAVEKATSEQTRREAALAQIGELQRLHELRLTTERELYERTIAERDVALKTVTLKEADVRWELQSVREELRYSKQGQESANALLSKIYRVLAFPRDPGAELPEIASKQGLSHAFVTTPPNESLYIAPCAPVDRFEIYSLNDMASPNVSGPAEARQVVPVGSVLAIPGGMSAVAEAARAQRGLYLLQGPAQDYLLHVESPAEGGGALLKLRGSGQKIAVTRYRDTLNRARCP